MIDNTVIGQADTAVTDLAIGSLNDGRGYLAGKGNLIRSMTDVYGIDLGGTLNGDPLLAPLGNCGGPAPTMALLPGSPAINASAASGASGTDQRGLGRVGSIAIGAFESQGFRAAAAPRSTPQTVIPNHAFANPLVATVIANNSVEPVDGGVIASTVDPASAGASATLSASTAVISGGEASVTATANGTIDYYRVAATSPGVASPANFALANVVHAPTANSQAVSVSRGQAAKVSLTGSDTNRPKLPLIYTVTVGPSHGTLSGTAPKLTYTPNAGYTGTDSFQFTVSNSYLTSTTATVSITVVAPASGPRINTLPLS